MVAEQPRLGLQSFTMFDCNNRLHNINMWLSVQYWDMFYSDNPSEWRENTKKVTFSDKDQVKEVQTEYQYYKAEDEEVI